MDNRKYNAVLTKSKNVKDRNGTQVVKYFDLTKRARRADGAPKRFKMDDVRKIVNKMNDSNNGTFKYGITGVTLSTRQFINLKEYDSDEVNEQIIEDYFGIVGVAEPKFEKLVIYIKSN